jgi:hypothetical protein
MNNIALPALRADRIVGFLAALGILRLLRDGCGDERATLAWPLGPYNGVVLSTCKAHDVGSLADVLFDIVEQCREKNLLLPATNGLPLHNEGSKADPMNALTFRNGRELAEKYIDENAASAWLASMVALGQSGQEGSLDRSRWWAVGPGSVHIAGTLSKASVPIKSAADLFSACTDWRRHNWVGGYLDVAADVGDERFTGNNTTKAAVVGATWLALMATPWFPVRTVHSRYSETIGWCKFDGKAHFMYPCWSKQLSAESIRVLLDHPEIYGRRRDEKEVFRSDRLTELGVSALFRATRLRSGKNNGALTHPQRIWPTTKE